ncbi:MAG: hypothetical protein ACRDH8_01750 [Actinomycetota bacterium]|jgi:hypothetical protein
MTHHVHEDPHAVHESPPNDSGSSWTGYAAVKYGFILIITIVILYFVARFLIPLFD